jgi:hypothetical protein
MGHAEYQNILFLRFQKYMLILAKKSLKKKQFLEKTVPFVSKASL